MTILTLDEKVDALTDYIMKWCLWQFHSRVWDRERQNEGILRITCQLLCGEEVDIADPSERCYWADAVVMARDYKKDYPWINEMTPETIKPMMAALKDRIDYLTVKGSLNKELTDPLY
ncbi:MAG: Fe-only nitrogenase subunit delta [Ethanoligenens sp.]|uniref:Fe-only nitrogenase subunit delta n=1 Tax=Ethanoligenens sp. TaxID=2099655 RepID=UPI0039E9B982